MPSTETLAERPAELSLGDALVLAVQLHRNGQLDDAETLYRRILDIDPGQPDALTFLGMLSMHRGRIDAAIDLIQKAIALEPGRADRYNNLGNVFLAAERVDEAVEAYRKAIQLDAAHADAWNNLAIVLRAQRKSDESARAYERAIELDPEHADAYNNYGNLLAKTGKIREAVRCYTKALALRPHDLGTKQLIAMANASVGDLAAAAAIYRDLLKDDDNPAFKHLLAACSGEPPPHRASDEYIKTTFDSFSKSFDSKLAQLEYRAPELVADALAKAVPKPGKGLVTLDAGCGTGLCGPLITAYVSRLHGVDLSSGMLEKARMRAVYDELTKAELTQYLHGCGPVYDLIVSADTLVYFGALEDVLQGAAQALRSGGHFIFTVEKADDSDTPAGHRLNPHGRYSHARDYVERALRGAGFVEITIDSGILRQEMGEPVEGLVVTAGKASPKQRDGVM